MRKAVLFAICYLLFALKSAHADFSLGIYPPIMQIQANAPTAIKKDITLVNASNNEQILSITFRLFTASPLNNGQVEYLPTSSLPEPDQNIFQKIQILDGDTPINTITIGPRQKKTLTLKIGIPQNETPADYYFSILFLSNNPNDLSKNGSTLTAGIASNVLLSIGPKDVTRGFLTEFSSPWFVQTGPVPFTVSISNTSKHYISPIGHILIRNMFGQLVGKVDLLPVNILGGTSRFIPTLWNEKFLFGVYRANIVVSLATDGPIFTKTIYFFAMPIVYIVGFFIAIILVSIVIMRVKRKVV